MKAERLDIDGLVVFEPRVFGDDRGVFFESFNEAAFRAATGFEGRFVQDNHSVSRKGVLRGLHYQIEPHAQGKLVRVVVGAAFDVAVDIRPGSPTFGRWAGVELSAQNRRQFWIPPGFAHGFLALAEGTEFLYKTTDFWHAQSERSLRWDDPDIGIAWPIDGAPVLSGKDAAATGLRAAFPSQRSADRPAGDAPHEARVPGDVVFDTGAAVHADYDCPACGERRAKPRVLTARTVEGRLTALFRCPACGSLSYHPFPAPDYTTHTDAIALREYVEMGGSIEGPAARIGRLIAPGSTGKLLDVGCGFGFAMAAVQGMTGWTARGFEPSQYGAAGRDQLGLDIVNGFAVSNSDPTELYDIVHCSEVIEHVPDPEAFLDLLVSYLAPGGVLVLTTPDAELVTPHLPPQLLLPALSPGAHTVLFSEPSMLPLLRRAGLQSLSVEHTGLSKLYYASRLPISLNAPETWRDRLLEWMAEAAEAAEQGSSLAAGLRYRAFRAAMDYGRYHLAERLYRPELAAVTVPESAVADIAAFAARWPFCIAGSTYYAGMFMLLQRADREAAARMFEVAHRLCLAKLDLAPHVSVVEADLVWRAVYHRALAQAQSSRAAAALETLRAFDEAGRMPPKPTDLMPAVDALRKALLR